MDEEPGDPGHEALERFLAEEIGHGVGSSDDGHGATVVVNELFGEVASFQAEDVLGGMGSLLHSDRGKAREGLTALGFKVRHVAGAENVVASAEAKV